MQILREYLFLIPLLVAILCEAVKIAIEGIMKRGSWHEGIFRPGGFPSTHSAFVTSLLIVVGRTLGTASPEFAISFVLAGIVWYDALSSRKAIGDQAKVLNRLQHWQHFSERLGHSIKEILGGIAFGAIVTGIGIWVS